MAPPRRAQTTRGVGDLRLDHLIEAVEESRDTFGLGFENGEGREHRLDGGKIQWIWLPPDAVAARLGVKLIVRQ